MSVIQGATESRRNIDLNIVPMIDLLSCLTAFLLVSAVWVNTSQLDVRAKGRASEGAAAVPRVGVLVQSDRMWVTVSELGEIVELPDLGGEHAWSALSITLSDLAKRPDILARGGSDLAVAAESTATHPVSYQALITAVDIAHASGFSQVGISDPQGLALRPTL
jgi:biopolymer transport protein ExbD